MFWSVLLALLIVCVAIWLIACVAVKIGILFLKALLWAVIVVFALGLIAGIFGWLVL